IFAQTPLAEPLKSLHVQDGGRIKPFNTFANEALQLIYGKETFSGNRPGDSSGALEKRHAVDIILTWMIIPDHWQEVPIVQIRHNGLKEALGLDPDKTKKTYFTPLELLRNDRLALLIQELNNRRDAQEKLDPYYQAVETLESQLSMFQAIATGIALRVLPPSKESGMSKWFSVNELSGESQEKFAKITQAFIKLVSLQVSATDPDEVAKVKLELQQAVDDFKDFARAQDPEAYGSEDLVKAEVHLKDFHPFQWAWMAYLLATILAAMAFVSHKKWAQTGAWIFMILGLVLHTYGMSLRVYIIGRPPVSNMYETVIWVPWGTVVFAMILNAIRKNYLLFIGAGLAATLCLILSDLSPVVLDPSLQPLQPVLRDNFWLVVHVIIIVTSYAAFFLAFAIGDILLFYFARDEHKFKNVIKEGVHGIYRSLQIGVVLLALGIITGGIWADYSWGRFWGWDPKETW
ncbi:MAG: cytochrome c biogenesis protein CcsA, partial [Bdellovibrionales bacterium]|nr:cytochrome c biogenesis protein CcsA [Bdellovibrionales bacterium]